MTETKAKVLYVINGFRQGGAEIGLATLLENGFLQDVDYKIFAFIRGDKDLQTRIETLAGKPRVITFNDAEKLSWKGLFQGAKTLWQLLRAYRPTSVVLSLKQANIVGRFLLIFFPHIYCIAFEHSTHITSSGMAIFYAASLKLLSFRADETWADTKTTLQETKNFYPWPKKRRKQIIPLFVAQDNKDPKMNYETLKPLKLLMVGRLIKDKNHDVVIRNLAQRRARGENISLSIFGTGPEQATLEKLAESLNVKDHVHFMGHVANWTEKAISYDILVNPSTREGFCIVVAEAMMVGLPVLATRVGGLCDYAKNGETALLIPPSDAAAFEDALTRLIQDETLRESLGRQASIEINKRYAKAAMRSLIGNLNKRLGSC